LRYKYKNVFLEFKGKKINVYKAHLECCPNKPEIIEDDRKFNEKIDDIIARHVELKKQKKIAASKFTCPYCKRSFKSENLPHLLGCVQANPEDREKLQEYFN